MADLQGLDLRDAVQGLVGYANSDLRALWSEVSDLAEARAALNDVLPALIVTYGEAAATLAADWYDELRDSMEIATPFRAVPTQIDDPGAFALVGWATDKAVDDRSLRVLVEGGMQRRIATYSRMTVMESSVADPRARGWQRVGSGACTNGFCDLLIARGAVYTERTAFFAAHDHCQCSAVPAFNGTPIPVKPYTPSIRRGEADLARTRAWIRANNA